MEKCASDWLQDRYPEVDYPIRRVLREKWNIDVLVLLEEYASQMAMGAELARLQAAYDSLAAENRLLLSALERVSIRHTIGEARNVHYCRCIELLGNPAPHSVDCLLDPANRPVHTSREVERVKDLEAVALACSQYRHVFYSAHNAETAGGLRVAHDALMAASAALDKVSKRR